MASGIHLSHTACVRAITGAKESKTGSSSHPAVIDTTVALLLCMRFPKHDAILRAGLLQLRFIEPSDCHPEVVCFHLRNTCNLRQPPPPWHRRFVMDFPDAATRLPDAKSIPRFRSVLVACTPRGCSRACSFVRTKTELLRTLDFFVAISHPACMSLLAMHVLARPRYGLQIDAGKGRRPQHEWTPLGALL